MSKVFKIGTSSNHGGCVAFGNMDIVNESSFFERPIQELKRNCPHCTNPNGQCDECPLDGIG